MQCQHQYFVKHNTAYYITQCVSLHRRLITIGNMILVLVYKSGHKKLNDL